jgi:diguanylate cyclase (GGDEF)-like protein
MWSATHGAGASWICRDAPERARFLDLHARLLGPNTRVLVLLSVVIVIGLPTLDGDRLSLLPALVGVVMFGAIQRRAARFARPEVWVFWALLGAMAMIAFAVLQSGLAHTGAIALLTWPVAGLAGRFNNRVVIVGTLYAMVLAAATIVSAHPSLVLGDPLTLTLPVVALFAVSTLATVHRDSDIEYRGAATIDALTGMLNRTALVRRRAEIQAQSRTTGEPVGLIIIDLDRFKAVNDTRGHGVGDAVLRDVAYILRRELRAYDLAYRLGGEEFAILLPGADLQSTTELAGQLHAAVGAEPIAGLAITISLGVAASATGTPFSWEAVFARADAALYLAKQGGRDRVVSDSPLAPTALAH